MPEKLEDKINNALEITQNPLEEVELDQGVTIWEEAASICGEEPELVRQAYLMVGYNYSSEEIRSTLEVDKRRINAILKAIADATDRLPPSELIKRSVGQYLVISDVVKDELFELYNDTKRHYTAGKTGATRHDDGTPVRRVALRDMVGLLQAIDGQASKQLSVKHQVARLKSAAAKGAQALPTSGEFFDPTALAEDIVDAEFTVDS